MSAAVWIVEREPMKGHATGFRIVRLVRAFGSSEVRKVGGGYFVTRELARLECQRANFNLAAAEREGGVCDPVA